MTLTFKDRVLESSTSTGTGDFVLTGPQTGYQGFTVVGNGATVPYTIQGKNPDGTLNGEWEVGEGTYHSSGNYISRDVVYESSNSNAKVAFSSGDKDVFLDLPGERIVQSPTIAVSNNFVAYDGVTGQVIKDSGSKASDFATAAQGAKADTAVQPGSLATVAFTGAYSDLTGKPTLGTAAALDAGVPNGVATLDAGGKVPTSQIPQMGDLNYQGTWNASTNTPTLTSSVGTKGYYYVVSVSGSTNLNGITDWVVGDWAVFNGSVWQKIDNTDAVTSVNGYTGTVVLTYTDVGAQPAGTYVTSVSGTAPVVSSGGTTPAISMHVADATHDGYLSSTDWSAFNSKVTMTYPPVGIPYSTGTAWGTSYTTTGTGTVVALQNGPTISGLTIDGASPYINMTPTTAPTYVEGRVFYDSAAHTLNYYNENSQMSVNIAQEQIIRVRNRTGSTIPDGSVVYISGATGQTPTITLAIATSFATSDIIGVTTTSMADQDFGYVTISGLVNGLDTHLFNDGDAVFLSATTPGAYTTTEPTAPNYSVQVGIIVYANNSNGKLLVATQQISTEVSHIVGTVLPSQGGTGQTSYTNGQLLIGNTTGNTLTKATLTAGTGIGITNGAGSITVTNSAPDQVVSLTGAGTTTVTGTYPSFTITSNDAYTGTVTNVTGTSPISVATGTTTPVVSISQANTSTNGYLSSTDWNTFNGKLSNPMTTLGDVIYGAASGTATRLAGNTTTAKQFLSQTGTGTASAAPAWSALPTVLPVLNRAGSTVSVSVGNGVLPVLNRAGSTVNVAIN